MTHKERILAHLGKFYINQHEYLLSLTEEQSRCITSYWDDPDLTHKPHLPGTNTYSRTFQFLGLKQDDPIVAQLFGSGLK